MVFSLERGANDLYMAQLMPLPHPIMSCFIKIQNGLTFLVPDYPCCPRTEAVKQVSVCLIRFMYCACSSELNHWLESWNVDYS